MLQNSNGTFRFVQCVAPFYCIRTTLDTKLTFLRDVHVARNLSLRNLQKALRNLARALIKV